MNFVCHGGTIQSINDKQLHRINPQETMICFKDALSKVKANAIIYSDLPYDKNYISLFPRDDGNYSMVDELFEQFVPNEKWASVSITGKDGKPFYIKDKWLQYQIIMRCESSIIGVQGNNRLLNKIIDTLSEVPQCKADEDFKEYDERYNKWSDWWGAKPHILDLNIFDVSLFSSCSANSCSSFVNPKNGKVGLLTNCRWTYESIKDCRKELQWICDEICDEENNLEFYVSFFNDNINYGKYKKEYKDPQFTFKLSHKGIELVPTIPIKNMKWIFKCNQNLHGKEWKKFNFLWGIEKRLRKLQKKFFEQKWVEWHNYTLSGESFDSVMTLSERYYTVNKIIKMIEMWRDYCIEWKKKKEEQ